MTNVMIFHKYTVVLETFKFKMLFR